MRVTMKNAEAIDQISSSIRWFINRGASLEGYLAFYKDSHYPPKQIAEIFEADKQSDEIERKRFKNLTGRHYGHRPSGNYHSTEEECEQTKAMIRVKIDLLELHIRKLKSTDSFWVQRDSFQSIQRIASKAELITLGEI